MKFSDLSLSKEFIQNLDSLGFNTLTAIQEQTLPKALQNQDLIARAKTGSGKTLAFCIPIVNKLKVKEFKIQALILAPTRELANQIAKNLRELSRYIHNVKVLTLCGGVPFKPQVVSLEHNAHIVVATPGRILKHILEKNITLENINTLVLDEADKMLDMGFYDDIMKIIENLPKNRQTMLFSATYEKDIENLGFNILNKPAFVEIKNNEEEVFINQKFYEVRQNEKISLIPALISSNRAKTTLIFCNMKITCEDLANDLYDLGLDVLTLHSNLDQKQRDETMVLFSNKTYPILIATDVASRGLHIDDVDLVINYDLSLNEKIHTHRIGRTARAGRGGLAVTLYTKNEEDLLEVIKENFNSVKIENKEDIKDDLSFEINCDFRTIFINGGKKQKLRKGDILGAMTNELNLQNNQVGKIDILDFCSYVAICKNKIDEFPTTLKIKGKSYIIKLK